MWDSVNVERHQENIALAPFTTLGIGGPSRWFARATYADELTAACGVEGEQLFVLGGGSNLVVADEGFRGLVCRSPSAASTQRRRVTM